MLLLLAAVRFTPSADLLSERDAVIKALSSTTDIQIQKIESQRDSLTLRSAQSATLPQLSINISSLLNDSATLNVATGTLSQSLPGGGRLFGTAEHQFGTQWHSSSNMSNTRFTVGVEQPLLKSAWSHAPVRTGIKITSLNNEILSIQRERSILSELSKIRNLYWSVYEQKQLERIIQSRLDQTKEHYMTEQQRYRLGEASPLDTLSAALQYVNAQRTLLSSRNTARNTLFRLASALRTDVESIVLPDSADLTVPDIPEPQQFIDLARRYDPQIQILQRMQELTALQVRQRHNNLLPEINVRTSYTHEQRRPDPFYDDNFSWGNGSVQFVLNYSLPAVSARAEKQKQELSLLINEYNTEQHSIDQAYYLEELRERWHQDTVQLEFADLSVELAQQQYEAVKHGYELGTEDRLSLIAAQNDLAAAKVSAIQAKIELKRFQIVFEEITGTLFERFGVQLQ